MTAALGFTVHRLPNVDSTNTYVGRLAEEGAPDGTLVVADTQTGGRGRHGRTWQSPPGNFHGSLLLRPQVKLADAASLSLVIGLAAREAVEAVAGHGLGITVKWPNDLLIDGCKLAGILLEGSAAADGQCAWLVAGLGVNLAWHPGLLDYPTTSLVDEGVEDVTVDQFLDAYLASLARHLPVWRRDGFAPFRDLWLAHAAGIGRPVTLRAGETVHRGLLADLDAAGSILIETPAGCLLRFTAGELFFDTGRPGLPASGARA